MKKVNMTVIKPWVSKRLVELLGFEDEVVIDFTYGLLEEPVNNFIDLSGFYLACL